MARVPMQEVECANGVAYRISKQVRAALEALIYNGASMDEAAQLAGLKRKSLEAARSKPHVRKVEEQMFAERRAAAAPRAWHGLEQLAFAGEDEKVRATTLINLLDRTIGKPGADAGGSSGPAQYVVIGQLNVTVGSAQLPDEAGIINGSAKRLE